MDDSISRQAAIDALKNEQAHYAHEDGVEIFYEYNRAIKALKNLPSAQPERERGKWINSYKRQTCSVCKQRGFRSWRFCPNCGADMRGDSDG